MAAFIFAYINYFELIILEKSERFKWFLCISLGRLTNLLE